MNDLSVRAGERELVNHSSRGSLLLRTCRFLCRIGLAAVFLMAAVTKITDLRAFADQLLLHSGLPAWLAWTAAVYLPWLELTCGFCLLLGVAQREAALLLSMLLVLFLGLPLLQPEAGDCGCLIFPRALEPLKAGWGATVRNLVLLGCGLWMVFPFPSAPSLPPTSSLPVAKA